MFRQLPLRLLTGATTALLWAFVTRDAGFGLGVLACAALATASRDRESFAAKQERALVIGVTLALVRLHALRAAGLF